MAWSATVGAAGGVNEQNARARNAALASERMAGTLFRFILGLLEIQKANLEKMTLAPAAGCNFRRDGCCTNSRINTLYTRRLIDAWGHDCVCAACGEMDATGETLREIISGVGQDPFDGFVGDSLRRYIRETPSPPWSKRRMRRSKWNIQ